MKMKIRNKAAFTQAVTRWRRRTGRCLMRRRWRASCFGERRHPSPYTREGRPLWSGRPDGYQGRDRLRRGEGTARSVHLEGLEEAGFTVTTRDWIQRYAAGYEEAVKAYRVEFLKGLWKRDEISIVGSPFQYPFGPEITQEDIKASDTDTCIYVVTRQAGEGGDRKLEGQDYTLSEEEKRNLEICARNYAV